MYTISRTQKIQNFSAYNEKLGWGKGFSYLTVAAEENEQQYRWPDIAAIQLQGKIRWTLHDLYTLPSFQETGDIQDFIEELGYKRDPQEKPSEFTEKIVQDLCLAMKLAIRYLESEEYYIVGWKQSLPKGIRDFLAFLQKWEKYKKPSDRIAHCVLLKEILGFFHIIRYKKFKVNYETGEITIRDKDFINSIIDIFNDSQFFQYGDTDSKFSKESNEAFGNILSDQKMIPFYAGFDVKWLYSVIEKIDGQEKYSTLDAFRDIHRMRIEVKTAEDALRIGKILFKKFWEDLTIDNVGWMIPEETQKEYTNSYLVELEDEKYKNALQKKNKKAKKVQNSSHERMEFRLSRPNTKNNPGIEIQIVLVNNQNETGWSHHAIYEMRRKILAKIRRYGWIRTPGIDVIVEKVFENNAGKNLPFSKEYIKKHLLEKLDFLVEIQGNANFSGDLKESHLRKTTKAYTTVEVLEKYKKNYPNTVKKEPVSLIMKNGPFTELLPLSKANLSSQPNQ